MPRKLGSELHPTDRAHVLASYVHRFTRSHVPDWAKVNPNYKAQFADDADWLAHTTFAVRADGRLDQRFKACESHPTWPDGKGVWGAKGTDW